MFNLSDLFTRDQLFHFRKVDNFKGILIVLTHLSIYLSCVFFVIFQYESEHWFLALLGLLVLSQCSSALSWPGLSHELLHGHIFTNKQLNMLLYVVCSTLSFENWGYYKKSHFVHHKYTLSKLYDFEVTPNQPALTSLELVSLLSIDLRRLFITWKFTILNSLGIVSKFHNNINCFPLGSVARYEVILAARIILCFHLSSFIFSFVFHNFGIFFSVSLSPFFFQFIRKMIIRSQHYDMVADEANYLYNSRSTKLNPILSVIYYNDNYHLEHHIDTRIPFYNLPKLRSKIKDEIPQMDTLINTIRNSF